MAAPFIHALNGLEIHQRPHSLVQVQVAKFLEGSGWDLKADGGFYESRDSDCRPGARRCCRVVWIKTVERMDARYEPTWTYSRRVLIHTTL